MELIHEEELFNTVIGEGTSSLPLPSIKDASYGKDYSTSAFSRIEIDKKDFIYAVPKKFKTSFIVVRRDKYLELRQQIADTYPNCLVIFPMSTSDRLFYGIENSSSKKLCSVFENNYIIAPLHRRKNRVRFAFKGIFPTNGISNGMDTFYILDIFIGGTRFDLPDNNNVGDCNALRYVYQFFKRTNSSAPNDGIHREINNDWDTFECDITNIIEANKHGNDGGSI